MVLNPTGSFLSIIYFSRAKKSIETISSFTLYRFFQPVTRIIEKKDGSIGPENHSAFVSRIYDILQNLFGQPFFLKFHIWMRILFLNVLYNNI